MASILQFNTRLLTIYKECGATSKILTEFNNANNNFLLEEFSGRSFWQMSFANIFLVIIREENVL